MKFRSSLLAILAAAIVVFSCKKELSNESGDFPDVIEDGWEFTESAALKAGPVDTAFIQTVGSVSTLSIIGTTTIAGEGEIFLQIVGEEITTGTFTNPLVFFQYSENGSVLFQSNPVDAGAFTIVITEIDSISVSGTFSGTVKDAQGNDHAITEGRFKTKVSYSDDDPDTIETGQLTVWSREICSDGSPMEIKVSGQTGQIDDGMTSEPVCGAAGTATFALITGNYTVEAICGTDTVRYEVVIDNKCTVLEIDMQNPPQESDYLPMVEGSSWTYADLSDVTSSHILKVEGSDVFEGRMFPRFVSNLGDTFYFRKDQGVYFEYRTLNFQDFVTNPPSIELVILHEDFDVGQSWESTVEDIILSNIPVKVMLRSTILRRDFIANIHGVDYPDCIEVNTEILFSSDGGNSFQAGNSFNRVFSKDRGIVYYYDINREVEWGVTSISINP